MKTLTLALALGLTGAFFAAVHKKVREREARDRLAETAAEGRTLDDTDLMTSTRPTFPPIEPEVR